MVVLEVYAKCIRTKYKAFLLSKATLIILICNLISLILPFIISYNTGGFWLKQDVVYEKPEVKFKGQYLLVVTFDDYDKPIICSSYSFYRKYFKSLDTCTMIQARETDEDYDGKPDKLQIDFKTDINKNAITSSIYLIVPLKIKLNEPCPCYIESTIIHQEILLRKPFNLKIYADMKLKQLEPIICPKYRSIHYNYSIIGEGLPTAHYDLDKIIERYSETKIKMILENVLPLYIATEENRFTISLIVKYPKQLIYFKPSFWQIVKFAWVQYLALYIVISWMIFEIKSYIFNNNLVLIYQDKNINK